MISSVDPGFAHTGIQTEGFRFPDLPQPLCCQPVAGRRAALPKPHESGYWSGAIRMDCATRRNHSKIVTSAVFKRSTGLLARSPVGVLSDWLVTAGALIGTIT